MEEKAREEVTDKRGAGSKRAEKEKEAEKAKDGAKEEAVVSMTWIYGEEVRTVEAIEASGTIRAITQEFGRSVV